MQQSQSQTNTPRVQKTSTIPKDIGNTFVIKLSPKAFDQRPYKDSAKILQEHIEIVAESRKMVSEGKTVEWEEFLIKHEGSKKR